MFYNDDMKVVFLRSHAYQNDGRLARYLKICKDSNVSFVIFDWNRSDKVENTKNNSWHKPFNFKAKTGSGFKNIFNLFIWNFYLIFQLILFRKEYKYVHAADLDTLLPALLVSKLFNKHLIFDIYDKYSASRKMPKLLAKLFDWIECKGIEYANDIIIPHQSRFEQLQIDKLSIKGNVHVFENIPLMSDSNLVQTDEVDDVTNSWIDFRNQFDICLAYVGIFEANHRGLENIINTISTLPRIGLIIAGSGELSSMIEECSSRCNNILFVGKITPEHAHYILDSVDVHVGFYYRTIPNHLYASPNKYYEHLFYGKALLTNEGVPPGFLVEKYDTGYAIGESQLDVIEFLSSLDLDDINKKGFRARELWEDKYLNYHVSLACTYQSIINKYIVMP